MSRNQRFAMMSMGRPFVPTMANPSGVIHDEARLQLIYCYPLPDFPVAILPLVISVSDALAFGLNLDDDTAYGASISDASAYSITLSDN